jgi:hypothetical protein
MSTTEHTGVPVHRMGILRDFERRLEGAVEGFFARAFRSGLQPVELAKAIQRYAADYQQVGIDGVFVPNVYRFELAADDHARFSGIESSLRTELADVLRRTAADRGWRLKGPVRIELAKSDSVRVGTYELRGKAEAGEPEPAARPAAPREPQRTAVMPAQPRPAPLEPPPPRPAPRAALRVVTAGGGVGRRYALDRAAVIGRLPQCEISIDDPSVSRRHARVFREGSTWQVEDLDSTNGVKLNGAAVGRASLTHGDELQLGLVRLAFDLEG